MVVDGLCLGSYPLQIYANAVVVQNLGREEFSIAFLMPFAVRGVGVILMGKKIKWQVAFPW